MERTFYHAIGPDVEEFLRAGYRYGTTNKVVVGGRKPITEIERVLEAGNFMYEPELIETDKLGNYAYIIERDLYLAIRELGELAA